MVTVLVGFALGSARRPTLPLVGGVARIEGAGVLGAVPDKSSLELRLAGAPTLP